MLKLENVVKTYPNGENDVHGLDHVQLEIAENEFVVVLGPSGSGKSTLINVASGLDTCDAGIVRFNDTEITKMSEKERTLFRRKNVGFVFQSYYLLPELTVENNIRMGAMLGDQVDYMQIVEALEIDSLMPRFPYQLSGGQQQRVAIARSLAKRPKVLFCDEPTGALDEKSGKAVLQMLENFRNKHSLTIVMVTHNTGIAQMATRVIRMNSGKIIEDKKNDHPIPAKDITWS